MNALDILKYGHLTVISTLEALPESEWDTPNVCGVWSTRQIMAHLASYEQLLIELFNQFLGRNDPTPYLDRMIELGPYGFNDYEVDARQNLSWQDALAEYTQTQAATIELATLIPAETYRALGTLPWYGNEYSLDDYLVYSYYGHKREHAAQIAVFLDLLKQP
jgi:uncharacterized damage-inducible protein DinB